VRLVSARQNRQELITAPSTDLPVASHNLPESLGKLLKNRVTRGMTPVVVVHGFEVIYVDHQHTSRLLRCAAQLFGQDSIAPCPIPQLGQVVSSCRLPYPLQLHLQSGHFFSKPGGLTSGVANGTDGL
jgi:hypothetical protein